MASPAPALAPAAKKKSPLSTFWLFASFGLVLLILFNPGLRAFLGTIAGYALQPTIGFGYRYPLLTILIASVLLVVGTTAIRHFLMDWVNMARVQEAMRAFQKEFNQARKDNNTYKLKKLTDAQPEVMALQADMSTEQMKPMAFTMILVIPIFAWLYTFTAASVPVDLVSAMPAQPVILADMNTLEAVDAQLVATGHDATIHQSRDFLTYALTPPGGTPPTGTLQYHVKRTGATYTVPLDGAPVVPESAKLADIPPGSYRLEMPPPPDAQHPGTKNDLVLKGESTETKTWHAIAIVMENGQPTAVRSFDLNPVDLVAGPNASLYVVVPEEFRNGTANGTAEVILTGTGPQTFTISAANVVQVDRAHGTRMIPTAAKVPWDTSWDLTENTDPPAHHAYLLGFLPRWIALYSLFGIPFGQIAQRALKLWEYRHHDLDGDGRTPAQDGA